MFCDQCGSEVNESANYCHNCGYEIPLLEDLQDTLIEDKKENKEEDKEKKSLHKNKDIVHDVYYSEDEIIEQLKKEMSNNGLYCKQYEIEVGETQTTGGGVLLGSGDVVVGGGSSTEKRKVWNPFLIKRDQHSKQAVKITIIEKSKISKSYNGVTYEGRILKIKKESILDVEFSGIGCLLTIFPGLLFILAFATAGGVGIVIGIGIAFIFYKIGEAITKSLVKRKLEDNELLYTVNNRLKNVYQYLQEEPF